MQTCSLGRAPSPVRKFSSSSLVSYALMDHSTGFSWMPLPRPFAHRTNAYCLIHRVASVQLSQKYIRTGPQISAVHWFAFAHICVWLLGWVLWHTLSSDPCTSLPPSRPTYFVLIQRLWITLQVQGAITKEVLVPLVESTRLTIWTYSGFTVLHFRKIWQEPYGHRHTSTHRICPGFQKVLLLNWALLTATRNCYLSLASATPSTQNLSSTESCRFLAMPTWSSLGTSFAWSEQMTHLTSTGATGLINIIGCWTQTDFPNKAVASSGLCPNKCDQKPLMKMALLVEVRGLYV